MEEGQQQMQRGLERPTKRQRPVAGRANDHWRWHRGRVRCGTATVGMYYSIVHCTVLYCSTLVQASQPTSPALPCPALWCRCAYHHPLHHQQHQHHHHHTTHAQRIAQRITQPASQHGTAPANLLSLSAARSRSTTWWRKLAAEKAGKQGSRRIGLCEVSPALRP